MKLQIITANNIEIYQVKKCHNPKRYMYIIAITSGSIAAILPEVPVVLPERVISGNIARN